MPFERVYNKFMQSSPSAEDTWFFFFLLSPPNFSAKQSSWLICVCKIRDLRLLLLSSSRTDTHFTKPVLQSQKVEILLLLMLFLHHFWELTFNSVLPHFTLWLVRTFDSWSHTAWLLWSCMICQLKIEAVSHDLCLCSTSNNTFEVAVYFAAVSFLKKIIKKK